MKYKRGLLLVLATMLIGLAVLHRYREYVFAICWHSVHGSHAKMNGRTVTLPMNWWPEQSNRYHTYLFTRATIHQFPSQILVTPAISVAGNDPEQDRVIQATVSLRNHDPNSSTSSSMVTVKSGSVRLYCMREEDHLLPMTNLFCQSAEVPYSFSYVGLRQYEPEAERILSTLR